MATTPETDVKRRLKKFFKATKWWWSAISDRWTSGLPDFIACRDGDFAAFEVKSKVGRLSPIQYYVARKIIMAGGEYFIVRPEGKSGLNFQKFQLMGTDKDGQDEQAAGLAAHQRCCA